MSASFDLVIRNGTVVTADGSFSADVGIRGESIGQLGGAMTGAREIDASGKLVMPGGIDAHVHLTPTEDMLAGPRWCDDFASGTRAAAAGGVTTVGNMTFPRGRETLVEAIEREAAEAARDAIVDVILHPVLTDPTTQPLSDIPGLAAAGHTSLKYFMSFGGFTVDPTPYLAAMRLAREAGMITLIHCEDAAMMTYACERLLAEGLSGIEHYPKSRPIAAEVSATARAVEFAGLTGAPTYIVHLSCSGALHEVRRGRQRHPALWIETRPLYLYLTEERFAEPDGAKYVGQPPLRTADDVAAIWRGLAAGEVDTVCTDHAAWRYADKVVPGMTVATVRPGVADLETLMPMLYSEGVVKGRITPQRFVAVTATNAAKLFGLFPRKGTIAVGADADLVIWDSNQTKLVRAADFQSNADYSPYEGWEVTGWPATTISRGEIVFDDGRILGKLGRGRLPRRGPTLAA
ncbi:MAG TPA: dihydropyrimidinase [Thermomicrobiales bacterium]|jgi:dihydropyrimidinase